MKIALIVIGAVICLIVLVAGIGAVLPRRHTATRSAAFQASPEEVFRLIAGPQDWRTDLKSYETFQESGREMRRETSKNGQTLTFELESSPPWLLKSRIVDRNLPFGGSWTYRIEARDGRCTLTITEDGEVYNPIFRFISRVVIGYTRTIDNYLAMVGKAAGRNRIAEASSPR